MNWSHEWLGGASAPASRPPPGNPVVTAKIEDLILDLKKDFTIVIVTPNMQQAARIWDSTAFFCLGELVESGGTRRIFTHPAHQQTEEYVTGRFG